MNDIPTIAANLHTQDGRMTNLPIFVVQQKRRIGGFEEGYADQYVWVSNDDSDEVDEDISKLLEEAEDSGCDAIILPDDPEGDVRDVDEYRKVYYRDDYIFVQPFFTLRGAEDYIAINGHNLREPRIYVESGYRNHEWETVRAHLIGLRGEGWKS